MYKGQRVRGSVRGSLFYRAISLAPDRARIYSRDSNRRLISREDKLEFGDLR